MAVRQYAFLLSILATTSLGGCSQTIDLYHDAEGGAIAVHRQPPPGGNLPYPNLADVPAAVQPTAPSGAANIGNLEASPVALAGLSLPTAPPPLPAISGVALSNPMASKPVQPALMPKSVAPQPLSLPPGPAVSIAFREKSALLPYSQQVVLESVAANRGKAHIRVCGFGGGSLKLALMRAQRLADALTAAGVPGHDIDMSAFAAGSGGFVQLVY